MEKYTDRSYIADKITKLMKDRGLTQVTFGSITGFDPSYISRVQNKKQAPSLNYIKSISEAFSLRSDYFLDW